jgi:hypothetical protein
MSPDVQLMLQFVVGLTFLSSTVGKIAAPALFFDGLRDYRMLPGWSVQHVGVTLIVIEGLIAFSFMSGWLLWPASLLALGLLGCFLVTTIFALRRGMHVKCLCFGASDTELVSIRTILRISLLAGVVAVLLTESSAREGWLGATYSTDKIVLALTCAALIQILISWALAIPEVAGLARGCQSCEHQPTDGSLHDER